MISGRNEMVKEKEDMAKDLRMTQIGSYGQSQENFSAIYKGKKVLLQFRELKDSTLNKRSN